MIGGCDELLPNGACGLLHDDGEGDPPRSVKCPLIRGGTCVKKLEDPPEE